MRKKPFGLVPVTLRFLAIGFGLLLLPMLPVTSAHAKNPELQRREAKKIIGPVALVEEAESDLEFKARVDTGATTSSVHVDRFEIEDEAEEMVDNVGKTIRFRINNHRGDSEWLARRIVDISEVKTSERAEKRYKVRMTVRYEDLKKRVLVSLNDRSHMNYPFLLGRNFLRGDFVVDVALSQSKKQKQTKSKATKKSKTSENGPDELQPTEEQTTENGSKAGSGEA